MCNGTKLNAGLTSRTVTIMLVLLAMIFVCPVKLFAQFEYITSMVKVILFVFLIVICVAMIGGAGKTGKVHHGSTWTDFPPFKNGFSVCSTVGYQFDTAD